MPLPWFQSKGQILQVIVAAIPSIIALIRGWSDMSHWWSAFFYGFFASSVVALVVSLISNRRSLNGSFIIHRAIYGPVNTAQAGKDETIRIRSRVQNDSLSILVGQDLLGDPFRDQFKQLTVDYEFNGHRETRITPEGHWCNLP
jgi:hypothetical protein